jgi:hypothetical protein
MKQQNTKKAIIFDSGTLISFSMNGVTDMLKKLKKIFNGNFVITPDVKREVIDRPIQIKKFSLEALKIKQLLDEKFLEMPSSLGLNDMEVAKKTEEMLDKANSTYKDKKRDIHILDSGEASCFAVDERTMRMLGEKPENLARLLEKKLHIKINPNRNNYNFFKEFKFIRSAELAYIAYKKGVIDLKNGRVLDALLYAMKFKGCAISNEEINEIERMA